jgi:hypothetical protein
MIGLEIKDIAPDTLPQGDSVQAFEMSDDLEEKAKAILARVDTSIFP